MGLLLYEHGSRKSRSCWESPSGSPLIAGGHHNELVSWPLT